ncbi:GntR family transcriptional regulator [Lactobacillus crispatus]|nr:hypothetical protein AEL97_11535 [Lactobacillus crispatus]KWU15204.1 hypothetical protein AEM00_03455 [Lactobacillus crispatus]MBI1714379.1 Bacterial regulatory protein, gntR family [Lactobacillus crispatus]TDM68325.1 GntR family transcriptional regulator [Lactobacillus crispatus]TDM68463.1 GntR family transcriptional regulator [Lactobacillus crispatus]
MCFFVQTNHTRKELLFLMFKEINLRNHSSLHKLFYSLQINTGHFKPGHLLSENQTRIKLNMSRTPIREAIKQLENEGLLVRQGQKKSLAILH